MVEEGGENLKNEEVAFQCNTPLGKAGAGCLIEGRTNIKVLNHTE